MSAHDLATFLASLDGLGHSARMRRAAELARDDSAEELATGLHGEGAFGGALAVHIATARRDEAGILRGLGHPSRRVQAFAARTSARWVSDPDALAEAARSAVPATRSRLLKALARVGSPACDGLLPEVRERWPNEAGLLLPGCSDAVVRANLEELGYRLTSWRLLALRHPDALLDWLGETFERTPRRERAGLWTRFARPLDELAARRVEGLLKLAITFGPVDAIPAVCQDHLARWTRLEPDLVHALLLRPGYRAKLRSEGLPRGVLKRARSLSQEQLEALARILSESPHHLAALLRQLPPSARGDLFTAAFAGKSTADLCWPEPLLEALPHAVREREAARCLALRAVRDDEARSLAMTALRDIDHTRAELLAGCRVSKAEERAQGWRRLIRATGLYRKGLGETLSALQRLKNEQDPVRLQALFGLARDVPVSLYTDEHVPHLRGLAEAVVEARDSSHGTRSYLQEVALNLFRAHADRPGGPLFQFALETILGLTRQAQMLYLPNLEVDLPRGAERALLDALLPVLRAGVERESYELVFSLALALGKRAWDLSELQELLGRITRSVSDYSARRAIDHWLDAPATRDARVRELVDADPSVVAIEAVLQHLHLRRQEWLDPFLAGKPIDGRWLSGDTIYILPVTGEGCYRWLPRQQAAFGRLLLAVARDDERDSWERAGSISRLGLLPVTEHATLEPFLRARREVDGKQVDDVSLIEGALGALAWLDEPGRSVRLLLPHLDGDRARVAMFALPRCLRFAPHTALVEAVAELLGREQKKITVHKEAVRLCGAHPSSETLGLLQGEVEKADLHRDVRIATGHAARAVLPRAEAWPILEALAGSPDPQVAESLLDAAPGGFDPALRARYARLVLQVGRHPELRSRRRAWTLLGGWSRGVEQQVAAEAIARLGDFEGGAEWREAAGALVTACRDGEAIAALEQIVRQLAETGVPAEHEATRQRDQPARQRLDHLLSRLNSLPGADRLRLADSLERLAESITDPTLWSKTVWLRVAGFDWKVEGSVLPRLRALLAEVDPYRVGSLTRSLRNVLARDDTEWEPAGVLPLVDALMAEADVHAQLVALALLQSCGGRREWDEETATRLRTFRQYTHLAVATEARGTLTSRE